MKKSPLFLSLFISSLLLCSCGKEITLSAEAPKWDVQTCDRCKMLVSDKKFSAQVVNPTDGKHFFFDDLGCALMCERMERQSFNLCDGSKERHLAKHQG